MAPALLADDGSSDIEFISMQRTSSNPASRGKSKRAQPPDTFFCDFCSDDLGMLSLAERQAHYGKHLDSEPSHLSALPAPTNNTKSSKSRSSKSPMNIYNAWTYNDVFWQPSEGEEPPENFTPGLIPLMKKALTTAHDKGDSQRAILGYPRTVHIHQQAWDGGWGCGYRNYLMACTALMEQQFQIGYFSLLDGPPRPSVRNLQLLIEEAWGKGYDEEGATQLGNKLVDSRKWIGTAELYVAFTYRGIPAQLVDFHLKDKGAGPLIRWIQLYFSPPEDTGKRTVDNALMRGPVIVTDRMPLILQHSGHSRTVVGYELTKKGLNLLVFDPSKAIPDSVRNAALAQLRADGEPGPATGSDHGKESPTRRFLQHMKKPFQRKRKASLSRSKQGMSPTKRMRAGEVVDDDVIVIDDDEEDTNQAGAKKNGNGARPTSGSSKQEHADNFEMSKEFSKVLKLFRVSEKSLDAHDRYQILCFPSPLGDPLSEDQKRSRRVVTSEKPH